MKREKLTLGWRFATTRVPDITFVDVTPPAPASAPRVERVLSIAPVDAASPLQICLDHWRAWMHQNDRDLGAKGQCGIAGGADDQAGYDDSAAAGDAAHARASREIATATDAMIDSLDRHHKAAIYRSCNISSVWRFEHLDFTKALPEAEEALIAKLSKNIATRAFF